VYPETYFCSEHKKWAKLKEFKGENQYSHVINYDAGEWCNKNAEDVAKNAGVAPERREPISEDRPDWDSIARGKVRHGVAIAFIRSGVKEPTEEVVEAMEKWVDYVMAVPSK